MQNGKSGLSIGYKNFSIGTEHKTYESWDGTERERSESKANIGYGYGFEVGFVIAFHASVSVSFSGIVDNFKKYEKNGGGGK